MELGFATHKFIHKVILSIVDLRLLACLHLTYRLTCHLVVLKNLYLTTLAQQGC